MKPRPALWIVAAVGLAVAPATAVPAAWLTELDDAAAQAASSGRPILVDLYADWCGWCQRLEESVYSKDRFQQFARDFVLLRVDTEDRGEGTDLANRFGVSTLPTLLILDHRLVKIGEVRGFAPLEPYIARITSELALYRRLEESFAGVGAGTEPEMLSALAREFHQRRDAGRAVELYDRLLALPGQPPEEERTLRLLLVDVLRMEGSFERAGRALDRVRNGIDPDQDPDLLAQLDLLQADLARRQGDCEAAAVALKSLLRRDPNSPWRKEARRALRALEPDSPECS